jgi:serine/threonine protein kinase
MKTLQNVIKDNIKLTKKLGSGAYGEIYECEKNKRKYAIKLINIDNELGLEDITEIDIMNRICHPNLVNCLSMQILDKAGRIKTNRLLIMIPLAIADLFEYRMREVLSMDIKKKIFEDCLHGLGFLHRNNILHMDIKLENILIFKDGNEIIAKLTDFGLSVYADRMNCSKYERELITITSRPPECFVDSTSYTYKADIWSLGISMFNLFSKTSLPIDGNDMYRKLIELFVNNVKRETFIKYLEYDEKLFSVFDRMIAIKPDYRYDVNTIIKMDFFNKTLIPGKLYYPTNKISSFLEEHHELPDKISEITKLLFASADKYNLKVETVFLLIDIFYRSIPYIEITSDNINIKLAGYSSFWIAVKLIEDFDFKASKICKIADNSFDEASLLEAEQNIILALNGILYRHNLFTYSFTEEMLLSSFKYLLNIKDYISLNLEDHIKNLDKKECHIFGTDSNDRFAKFYKKFKSL